MSERNSFAVLLKQFRLEAGFTQEALAERAFVSAKSIGSLERDPSRAPRLDTVRVLADALSLDAPHRERFLAAARPAAAPDVRPPDSLPVFYAPTNPLYGRDRELDMIERLLVDAFDGSGARMIVLTGPGGVGKTRLARSVGASHMPPGVRTHAFVDLASIERPGLVLDAIARQLGLSDRDTLPVGDRVVAVLNQGATLLTLDNAEHLLDARVDLMTLLDRCSSLVLLITSRIAFGVRAEHQVRLEPLELPPPDSSMTEIVQSPAVILFIDRARAAGWASDSTYDLQTIAQICRRLDGLPLAIELAAAWSGVLSPAELWHRMENRLPLLTRGRHDMATRHRTMRSAIAWSYEMLDPAQQARFQRVCIFENGAPLSIVRSVVGDGADAVTIESELADLTDHSLIGWQSHTGDQRLETELRILETIREFGLERLRETAHGFEVAQAHASVMLEFAERLERDLGGPDEAEALRKLDQAYPNVRAALTHSIATFQSRLSLRFVGALGRYWLLRGVVAEGLSQAKSAIALADSAETVPASAWIHGLTGTALLEIDQGDLDAASWCVDRALTAVAASPDADGVAAAQFAAGLLAAQRGENSRAEFHFQAGLDRADAEHDLRTRVGILEGLSQLAFHMGDPTRAVALEVQRLEQCRRIGDRRGVALSTKNLAFHAMYGGRFPDAQRLGAEAARELRQLGDTGALAEVLWALGYMAQLQGDLDLATEHLIESRVLRLTRGDERNAAKSNGVLAVIAIARGNEQFARELLEEADEPLRSSQDLFGLALNSLLRGHVAFLARDVESARIFLLEGGGLLLKISNPRYLPWFLEGIANLAAWQADWTAAAGFIGAHDALAEQSGGVVPPVHPAALDAARNAAMSALGKSAYDESLAAARRDPVALAASAISHSVT